MSSKSVDTSKLREGDIVIHYGMRLRLGEIREYEMLCGQEMKTVYASDGELLNPEEVRERGFIPWGLLFVYGTEKPVWRVQGNDLAWWAVEE